MSDFPFDVFRGIQNGDNANLNDVEVASLTFEDGSTISTSIPSKIETAGVGATGKVECTEGSVVTNIAGNIIECSSTQVKLTKDLVFNDNSIQSTAFTNPSIYFRTGATTSPATNVNVTTYIGNVVFDNEGTCYNSTTGKFTATKKGLYYFCFNAFNNDANSASRPAIYVNNDPYYVTGATTYKSGMQVSGIVELEIDDYVNIQAHGSFPIYYYSHADATSGWGMNNFYGYLIHET